MRLLSLCLFLILPAALWAEEARLLTVTGVGEVTARPDMASLTLGVTERNAEAAAAMDAVSATVATLFSQLEESGVTARDIQTSDLSLRPVWDRNASDRADSIAGFEASNQLSIRVRDLDALGGILQALLRDGANRFNGLTFGLQDPRPVEDEARRAAVADALAKAKLYADAAGVTLGPIESLVETGAAPPRFQMMDARAEAMPIAAGETSVSARVTVVFAIE